MKINAVDTFLVDITQKPPISPYRNRYNVGTSTAALLVRLETDTGIVGWGETPQRWINATGFDGSEGPALLECVRGWDPFEIERLYLESGLDGGYLQSGVEMACWDIQGKVTGRPLYELFGGAVRTKEVELAACMGIQPYDRAGELARLYVEQGFSTLKAKAGCDADEDLTMVRGVRDAVGDRLRLRIDPNQGYTPEVALALARDLEPYTLQYLEQPIPLDALNAAAKIRAETDTPIALNESVTTPAKVLEILEKKAADMLVPDTYQSGGLLGVRKVAALGEAAGLPCVMHCAHDLGVKTAAMLHLVVSTPSFTLANDCTYYGLEDDILTEPFRVERGRLRVPEAPGLGVDVDVAKLERYRTRSWG